MYMLYVMQLPGLALTDTELHHDAVGGDWTESSLDAPRMLAQRISTRRLQLCFGDVGLLSIL
ncbi:predicted protein [Plenodomus lingam JN3]|uniref:Predicted protein n=1 Tax=Leptosphaeria maculans (strain JN3 / isolate v23.1.3 / race Av1-4-5-6-7-8) TaxID=985895 RepID=E4ZXC4_LEPMJ|nr:predicted protein [Plenodomus lingam JN3]CBX95334.1 predicted protein [Plenodomus lingam JN3]